MSILNDLQFSWIKPSCPPRLVSGHTSQLYSSGQSDVKYDVIVQLRFSLVFLISKLYCNCLASAALNFKNKGHGTMRPIFGIKIFPKFQCVTSEVQQFSMQKLYRIPVFSHEILYLVYNVKIHIILTYINIKTEHSCALYF